MIISGGQLAVVGDRRGIKLTDADAENSETGTWLDCAMDCQYLPKEQHERLSQRCQEIGAMIGSMLKSAPKFVSSP